MPYLNFPTMVETEFDHHAMLQSRRFWSDWVENNGGVSLKILLILENQESQGNTFERRETSNGDLRYSGGHVRLIKGILMDNKNPMPEAEFDDAAVREVCGLRRS